MDHTKEIAEIWALFRENREQLLLQREQFQETKQLLKEESLKTERQFQETDRRLQESDRQFQETKQLLKEESLKTERQFQETDRRLQESDRQFQETKQLLQEEALKTERLLKEQSRATDRRLNKLYGTFSDQWGRLMEALVKPDSVRLFQERGIQVTGVNPRMERHRNGETMELDLVLLNSTELVVVEVKSRFSQAEVVEFLEDLGAFARFFPEYRAYRVYGAIAGLAIPMDVGRYAYRRGLFVVEVSGQGLVAIKNDATFKPKDFGVEVGT